ncbi:MAG: hypothetical protein MJK15_19915 [Colwellia sp.]|nr:hypothetical protein [Colwellia sp.]
MIRKLIFSCLLLSFASYGEIKVLDNGDIKTAACAYGRGQGVITQARNAAVAEIGLYIKGNKILGFGENSEDFESSLNNIYTS